eukprot:s1833_g12.t2
MRPGHGHSHSLGGFCGPVAPCIPKSFAFPSRPSGRPSRVAPALGVAAFAMLAPASDRALRGRGLALKASKGPGRIFAFAGPKGGLKPQSPAAADLGFFVGLQGTEKDYVLVQPVSDGGLSEAAAQRRDALLAWGYGAGHGLPQVVDLPTAQQLCSEGVEWEPYCWSEDLAKELQSPCPQMELLHGKTWAVQRAVQWRQDHAEELRVRSRGGRCGSAVDAGVICSSEEEALKAIDDIGPRDAFIKAELGWAGQSNRISRYSGTPEQRQHFLSWLRARLQDGDVLVEPEYQRVLDFSVQFDVLDDGISIFSKNIFRTNERGHFVSTDLSPNVWINSWAHALDTSVSAAEEFADWIAWSIAQCVGRALQSASYRGPCGVDGFLCAEPEGRLLLQPISDVNPRQTMTRLAVHVAERCPKEWQPRQLRMFPRHKAEELERSCGTEAMSAELADRLGLEAAEVGLHAIPLTPLGHRNRRQRGLAAVLLVERSSSKCDADDSASELKRFAERVLLEGSLEAKLQPPERELYRRLQSTTSLEKDSPPLDVAWPRRNQEIELCRGLKGGSDQLPKMSRIIASNEAKIQCLHKFANHELQAIEMFAWALLRFPDAPEGLKLGLLRTLEEEQSHCRLYLQRAKAIAAASNASCPPNPLGPTPLSGYLWSCLDGVRQAEDPLLAFLCGIGLTFEAANLDHSLRYRDIFLQAGDHETAAVLQRVHDEEVQHVRLANVWLRRLAGATPGSSEDLELYQRHAMPPAFVLYKARGKGFFGEAARRKAGLSEEMIAAVKTARIRGAVEGPQCQFPKPRGARAPELPPWAAVPVPSPPRRRSSRRVQRIASRIRRLPRMRTRHIRCSCNS